MTVLAQLPPTSVIQSHKGVLDYYVWRGLPVVRSWPRKSTKPLPPDQAASAAAFATYSRALTTLPKLLYDAALENTAGSKWTWKDETTAAAYGNLHTNE